MMVATFPYIMSACSLGLSLYFQTQGGYKPKILISQAEKER